MASPIILVAVVLGVLGALAFVLTPLVRDETELKPFRRARPGMRHLHGLESIEVELPDETVRHCPHCGTLVERDFDFCGECCSPLP